MAGPQVRGDIKVSRNVQVKKVRQGVLNFVPDTNLNTDLVLVSGDPFTIIVSASNPIIATTVTLPAVTSTSSITTVINDASTTIDVPRGPTSGVGTEFRIVNNSGAPLPLRDSAGVRIGEIIPNNNTSIAYCDTANDTVGTWQNYIVDAATTQLTPVNVTFDADLGTVGVGSILLTGNVSSVARAITVSFTSAGGEAFTITTPIIPGGTTVVASANILVTALNEDRTFPSSYTASIDSTQNAQVNITAIITGTGLNSGTIAVTVPDPYGVTATPVSGGTAGSWRTGTDADDGSPVFEFRIAQVTHGRGLDPVYQVFEDITDTATMELLRSRVLIDSNSNSSTGEIVIQVNTQPIAPSNRFAGSVDIL